MANFLKTVFVFCATIYVVIGKHEQYDGYSLYEVIVKDVNEAAFIHSLENEIPIDVFSHAAPERAGEILVPKDLKPDFESRMTAQGIEYKIIVLNIRDQLLLEDQLLSAAAARANTTSRAIPGLNFEEIHRTDVVYEYLDRLAEAYPNLVTVESAGRTFENREMKYVKISTTNFQDTTKPVVVLTSLLHCREWAGLPAALYAIEKLVIDVQEQDLQTTIDWIIMPVVNPDGYEFTHTNTRFWRKNRRTGLFVGDLCMGVDLNRNFDIHWGTASSNIVCMDTFHGLGPFSEPEAANLRDLLNAHRDRIELYIDIHSFGSMILYAYGNGQFPGNALTLNLNAVNQAQAIDRVKWPTKQNYIVGNIFHVLYAASGGSSDYAQSIGIPFSYTYELPAWRGVSGIMNGFLVDPEFIWQVGFETWEGIKTGARFARDLRRNNAA